MNESYKKRGEEFWAYRKSQMYKDTSDFPSYTGDGKNEPIFKNRNDGGVRINDKKWR